MDQRIETNYDKDVLGSIRVWAADFKFGLTDDMETALLNRIVGLCQNAYRKGYNSADANPRQPESMGC